ncbi:XdhC family protein [Spirosoma spitsbergense]|uniref:XdhC family protein n=1 Tax=Spirosoma spitsbergense TaxID=431554 RepID=UPI000372088F|nr:XdhC/CoxI family protein [Spirosoma spitsbergense]
MIKSLPIWQLIHKSRQQRQPVTLLYVLESHGSSPGRQGFLMAVNAGGEMAGSIGGGIMEHKFVELAKDTLRQNQPDLTNSQPAIRTQYHDKNAAHNQSGMICSGDQTILLYPIQPGDSAAVQAVITCLEQHKNGLLELSPAGIRFTPNQLPDADYQFTKRSENDWLYRERIGYKNQLYIIGGGHCALALSELMSRMDFYVRVFDDRPDLYTMALNDTAHEKIVVADYSELSELIPPGRHQYVVVMTMGYRTDDLVVRALLGNEFAYVGVLGSKTKVEKLLAAYRSEGFDEAWLKRMHAPIGMAINSQTPEEIAVSIAAEIIQVKNAR